jgi:hypothetical protein
MIVQRGSLSSSIAEEEIFSATTTFMVNSRTLSFQRVKAAVEPIRRRVYGGGTLAESSNSRTFTIN